MSPRGLFRPGVGHFDSCQQRTKMRIQGLDYLYNAVNSKNKNIRDKYGSNGRVTFLITVNRLIKNMSNNTAWEP